MPWLLSKKVVASTPKKSSKLKFKPPSVVNEKISKILKNNENPKTEISFNLPAANENNEKSSTKKERKNITISLKMKTSKTEKSKIIKTQIKKANVLKPENQLCPAPSGDFLNSSTELSSICLSQEVLNKKEIKKKYLEFWNESMTPDIESEIQALSQEFKEDGQKNKKKLNKNKSDASIKNLNRSMNYENEPKKTEKLHTTDIKSKKSRTKTEIKRQFSKNNTHLNEIPTKKTAKPKKITSEGRAQKKIISKQITLESTSEELEMDLYEKMCLLQESRNVGLYAFCDTCNKQRYLAEIKDPLELPNYWYCWMNTDTEHNKCTDEEIVLDDEEEEYNIYNKYNAGSIVWAKMEGYPWWPAMVEDDPDCEQYFWLEEDILEPTFYHVTFFDTKEVTRAWIKVSWLKPFERNMYNPECQVSKLSCFKSRVDAAYKNAEEAIKMPLLERLRIYGFIQRYKKPLRLRQNKAKNRSVNKKKNKMISEPKKINNQWENPKENQRKRKRSTQEESISDILENNLAIESELSFSDV